ncbi:Hpt domain-containing protein [Shewanella sp. 1CM18E]|uniref:Hpt domain-containing protein n=1 Tax=Shewanella sp. 1CM18E TaxID=2929169 RepID=UPI0020BF299A|nr:Hpt domain-containing protein [Shewanella sp. 1CM18E]MCK8043280.1 Hpt domain-containing protein [Shewanella sp. 1CM18E]
MIDETILNELTSMLGEESIQRMLIVYTTEVEERLQVLAQVLQAFESGNAVDFAEVEIQAHTLKSSSASFGAIEFSSQAEILEHAAKAHDLSKVVDQLGVVNDVGTKTLSFYSQRLAPQG